jgi:proteasome accessory factor C
MPPISPLPRIQRILLLVSWVMAHPGATRQEVCEKFGITTEDLLADLSLLSVCGLPPFTPGDLIWAEVDGDRIVIQFADYLARPLRLSRWEAVALLVMGRAMAKLPGLEEAESLKRALDKLEGTVGPDAAETAAHIAVDLDTGESETLSVLREAIAESRRVHMTYYSYGRDETTDRVVEPWIVFGAMRSWYVAGRDVSKDEERVFRVDRIKDMAVGEDTFDPPTGLDRSRYERGSLYTPSDRDTTVILDLAPEAAWVAEVTPNDGAEQTGGGWTRLTLRTGHLAWLERLLLQLGEAAKVVVPKPLSEGTRAVAARALARYS